MLICCAGVEYPRKTTTWNRSCQLAKLLSLLSGTFHKYPIDIIRLQCLGSVGAADLLILGVFPTSYQFPHITYRHSFTVR